MSDAKFIAKDGFFDIEIIMGDISNDDGLESAVLVSLFTDKRVLENEMPEGSTDKRGWWGDIVSEFEQDQIGSKLWLLDRGKADQETRVKAQQYASDALDWMLRDGLAETVTVTSELVNRKFIYLDISIVRPKASEIIGYRFQMAWDAQGLSVKRIS